MYFLMFIVCVNTRTSTINTNVFFDFTDFQVRQVLRVVESAATAWLPQLQLGRVVHMLFDLCASLAAEEQTLRAAVVDAAVRVCVLMMHGNSGYSGYTGNSDHTGTTDHTGHSNHMDVATLASTAFGRGVSLVVRMQGGGGLLLVREIAIVDTCWWYLLCNFQYRQYSENTCPYNFDC